jgi:hypothetical protein
MVGFREVGFELEFVIAGLDVQPGNPSPSKDSSEKGWMPGVI